MANKVIEYLNPQRRIESIMDLINAYAIFFFIKISPRVTFAWHCDVLGVQCARYQCQKVNARRQNEKCILRIVESYRREAVSSKKDGNFDGVMK